MMSRQNPQHFAGSMRDDDVAAERVHHVDTFGFSRLPGSGFERIRLRRQRPNRTQIDHVAAQFAGEKFFHVGPNLHIRPATGGAQICDPRDFVCKSDATGTMNASSHDRFHQRAYIFVFDRAFSDENIVSEPAPIRAERHRLVLKIAFAALVANRTIQRMIHQQKFHYAFAETKNNQILSELQQKKDIEVLQNTK